MRHAAQRLMAPLSAAIAALALASAVPAFAAGPSSENDTARDAQGRVSDAVSVVKQMKLDAALAAVLQQAKGIFIIPHFGKGGLIVGGEGGGGVVLVRHGGNWSSPAFYSMAGGSIGAQLGGEGGAVALILVTQKAVDRFQRATGSWALNGSAGLTLVNWSGKTEANTVHNGSEDVIVWTNTKGLYGGLTVGVQQVSPDSEMNRAYYQPSVSSTDILAGNISSPGADPLRNALASRVASR